MQEAIKDLNQAVEIDPLLLDAYYNRGTAKSFLKQDKEAMKDFNKAIELNLKMRNFLTMDEEPQTGLKQYERSHKRF